MKIRVALSNETTEVVESNGQIRIDIDHRTAALQIIDRNSRIVAAFGSGCWLSAVTADDKA